MFINSLNPSIVTHAKPKGPINSNYHSKQIRNLWIYGDNDFYISLFNVTHAGILTSDIFSQHNY